MFKAINSFKSLPELKKLIDNGADINGISPEKKTPLIEAIKSDNQTALDLMLRYKNLNPNIQNKDGNASIHFASKKGDTELVRRLIERGVELNLSNQKGSTPMFLALAYDHLFLASYYQSKGISVDQKDKLGYTPLMGALATSKRETVRFIMNSNIDINHRDNDTYKTYLMYAAQTRHLPWVKLFKDNSINARSKNGSTALIEASGTNVTSPALKRNSIPVIRYLLSLGAKPNLSTKDEKFTAFHYAARNNDLSLIKILKKHGANLKLKNGKQQNALILASFKGNLNLIKYLLRNGLSPHEKDIFDKSAVDYAKHFRRQEFLKLYEL